MTWRDPEHTRIALKRGHTVISAQLRETYLDYAQSHAPTEPQAQPGPMVDLRTVHGHQPPDVSTKQTEVLTKALKFKNGTYAARVKFRDVPKSGPDGDHLVQTFFTINDLKAPMADDYAEYDFEYLPNGGWGEPSNIRYTTSWETYNPDPWQAVNQHTESRQSYGGWHDLVLTIGDSSIRYSSTGSCSARTTPRTSLSGPCRSTSTRG